MNALVLVALLAGTPSELSPPPPPPANEGVPAESDASAPTTTTPAPAPGVTEAKLLGETLELDRDRPTVATLSFSPLTTFMLGVVLEGEFRVNEHLTTYLAGEFYGAWLGWGAQAGLRWYPSAASSSTCTGARTTCT